MHNQILNEDGTLNILWVTVQGLTKDGVKIESFPYTTQFNHHEAIIKAKGLWRALYGEVQHLEAAVEEHEVLCAELGTADRIKVAEQDVRNAINQHFDNANGEHYAILNGTMRLAFQYLLDLLA